MNEQEVINKVKKFLNDEKKLNNVDFKILFDEFNKSDLIEAIKILKKNNIEIVINSQRDTKEVSINNSKNYNVDYRLLKNLSNEQLCELYKQGNKKVLDAIVEKNEKLIWSRVRKYSKVFKHKLEEEDLFQSGVIGLMKAVENFENDKGANLSTYSVWWIDQKIRRDIIDLGFTIRIPVHMVETILKVNNIISKNENLSRKELLNIAQKDGITEENFKKALSLRSNILSVASINALIGDDDDSELIDFIEDKEQKQVEDEVIEKILIEKIELLLGTLKEREKNILQLRFGLIDGKERTLEEIGKIYGVTRERIRQIEAKALRKLRHPSRSKKIKNFYIEEE